MAVTEQIDAIRALGADPVKKLVVPRLVASVLVMPVLGAFALVLGFVGRDAHLLERVRHPARLLPANRARVGQLQRLLQRDVQDAVLRRRSSPSSAATSASSRAAAPRASGQATTRTVVAISITILIADFFLTKVSILLFPGK